VRRAAHGLSLRPESTTILAPRGAFSFPGNLHGGLGSLENIYIYFHLWGGSPGRPLFVSAYFPSKVSRLFLASTKRPLPAILRLIPSDGILSPCPRQSDPGPRA
jgi:hypothetical protein